MKTQLIGRDYLLPRWALYVALVVLAAIILAMVVVAVRVTVSSPARAGSFALKIGAGASICAGGIVRIRTLLRYSRDASFTLRIKEFRALKKRSWDSVMADLLANPDVEIVSEDRVTLANPLTWRRKQRVIVVKRSDLFARIYETNGKVGTIVVEMLVE